MQCNKQKSPPLGPVQSRRTSSNQRCLTTTWPFEPKRSKPKPQTGALGTRSPPEFSESTNATEISGKNLPRRWLWPLCIIIILLLLLPLPLLLIRIQIRIVIPFQILYIYICIILYIHLCPPSFVLKITARNQFHAIEALNFYQFINWFRWPAFVAPAMLGVFVYFVAVSWLRLQFAHPHTIQYHPIPSHFSPLSPAHWELAGQIIAKRPTGNTNNKFSLGILGDFALLFPLSFKKLITILCIKAPIVLLILKTIN